MQCLPGVEERSEDNRGVYFLSFLQMLINVKNLLDRDSFVIFPLLNGTNDVSRETYPYGGGVGVAPPYGTLPTYPLEYRPPT